jgi:hypothetical protein
VNIAVTDTAVVVIIVVVVDFVAVADVVVFLNVAVAVAVAVAVVVVVVVLLPIVVIIVVVFVAVVIVVIVVVASGGSVSVAINHNSVIFTFHNIPTFCAVPVCGSMKCFSSFPAGFFTINSIHLFHRRSGILVLTQNQTKAFVVTVPPLIVVQLDPQ